MEDEFDKFIMEMEGLKMVMEGKKTEKQMETKRNIDQEISQSCGSAPS